MEILAGPDVSVAITSACAPGADGRIVNEAKVPSDPGSLVEHMHGLPGSIAAVGLEAGPLSQWLRKGLGEAGHETVLMVRRVKSALKAAPVRTDRRDAEGIAQLLRTGWFQPVHCRPVASRETRALPGSRNALAEGLTRPGLPVRGILRNFGLKPGRVSKGDFEERVREPASGNATLPDATCRQLMTMPGTGRMNWLKSRALRLAARRGKKRATAAPARRMAVPEQRRPRRGFPGSPPQDSCGRSGEPGNPRLRARRQAEVLADFRS